VVPVSKEAHLPRWRREHRRLWLRLAPVEWFPRASPVLIRSVGPGGCELAELLRS
jgi:hypothetical protein